MVGGVFTIPLPLSKVSAFFDEKPEFVFYPYFFGTEGDFTVLEAESPNESLGKREIVVYLPPGIILSFHLPLHVSVIVLSIGSINQFRHFFHVCFLKVTSFNGKGSSDYVIILVIVIRNRLALSDHN
jgi:hypothetical protein